MKLNTLFLTVGLLCVGDAIAALDTACADTAAKSAEAQYSKLNDYQLARFKNESSHIAKYCTKEESKDNGPFGSYAKCHLSKWRDAQRYKDLPIGISYTALVGLAKCLDCTKIQTSKVCGDDVFSKLKAPILVLAESDDVQKQVTNIAKICRIKKNIDYVTCSQQMFTDDIALWQNHVDLCNVVVKELEKCVEKEGGMKREGEA